MESIQTEKPAAIPANIQNQPDEPPNQNRQTRWMEALVPCYYPKPLNREKLKKQISPFVMRPCGKCIGCRLEKARQWAIRCMHESTLQHKNCFATLTYDQAHLPPDLSVHKRHLQLFLKRLRKHHEPNQLRFFACGEYGDRLGRPHYHCILFGIDFEDKTPLRINPNKITSNRFKKSHNFDLYGSDTLAKIWGQGFVTLGDVTIDSAGYVARYTLKKITGDNKETHYKGRQPKFALMSRRPGIGHDWFHNFKSDVFPKDFFTINGLKYQPPRYYDTQLEKIAPREYDKMKERRHASAKDKTMHWAEGKRREKYKKLITKSLERNLE